MEYLSPREGGLLQILLLALGLLLSCTHALCNPIPIVRVMVDREKAGIRIEGFDLLVHEADSDRQILHANQKALLSIQCSLGDRMEIKTGQKNLRVRGPVHVSSLGGFIRVGSSQYRDDLYIYSFNGDCIVVNHVDLEKYVAGLLNSEMSARWSSQALMAQAVAARTYAIYQMQESSTTRYRGFRPPFDLEASVKDQVYEGAQKEHYRALRAVQDTRGQILTHERKPIKAFYHSTCGGHTETPDRVWGARYPYLVSVRCDFCQNSPRFNWAYSVNTSEFEHKLRQERLLKGALIGIRVKDRNNLGRADKVEVRGTLGTTLVNAPRLRDLAGTLNIRSTDFTVVRNGGKLVFVGHGSGHGVGMCQWGAKTLGERGRSYAQILKHYYPMAEISKLY